MKHQNLYLTSSVLFAVLCAGAWEATAAPPRPATDEDIKEGIAAAGDAEEYDGADIVYVLDEADVYVDKSGLATTESCRVVKVLTDAGVRSHSVLHWEYDPDTYRTTIKSVRIHRQDGSIEPVPMEALTTQPAPQHMIYWGNMQHLLPIPRLDIGDALEIRTSKIGFNIAYLDGSGGSSAGGEGGDLVPPMPGHWYEVTLFQAKYPIVSKRYSVYMPKDMPIQYEVYNGALKTSLWFKDDYLVYTFEAEDVPAVKKEPNMVALDDFVPKLVMATLESWEAKSRWFHDVNESQFEADDAIRAKVAELTAGMNDEEDKIAACVHWVADNIRYYGTKRGPCEGYTLHESTETFRDLGGVCKDKAGLAVTMLRVLGYETYPALTMAGSRVEAIPADQFNHTVTVMRNKDGSFRALDPTWVPLTRGLWSSFENKQALVYGTPEGHTLTHSPHFEPEYNARSVRSVGRIRDDGTLVTNIRMDLKGAAGNRFRRAVNGFPAYDKRSFFEEALNIAPNAQIEDLSHVELRDYSRDAFVEMKVTAEAYAAGGNGVHFFRLPLMTHPLNKFFRASFMDPGDAEERQYAMHLWATRLIRYEETLELPHGWTVTHVPEAKTLDTEATFLSFDATPGEGSLTYRFEFQLKKSVISVEDFPDYKKAIDAMKEIADDWVVCKSGPGSSEIAKHAELPSKPGEVRHD